MYHNWRKSIPWTNDQIADALESQIAIQPNEFMAERYRRNAQWVRKGGLTNNLLGQALDVMVKVCAVCGKTAHYRYGNSGRCRVHLAVKDPFVEAKKARIDLSYAVHAQDDKNYAFAERQRLNLRRSAKAGKNRP